MKSKFLLLAVLGALSLTANATGNDVSNNCPGNSCHNDSSATGGNATSSAIASSQATGVGVGIGGAGGNSSSVSNGGSVNSDIKNTNVGINTSSNVQSQIQGQGQKQATENSNNSTVTVNGDNFEAKRIPVSTAYAPSIAPTAPCALAVNAGVSVIGLSGSFGKAYIDENCAKLEAVRSVALVLGDKETAEAMMCQDSAYAKARLTAGRACPVEQE